MAIHDLIPSFNCGEVSPLIDARTSLEKYKSACRTLENFIILPYGGVNRRPGTEYQFPVPTVEASWSVSQKAHFEWSDTCPRILTDKSTGAWGAGIQRLGGILMPQVFGLDSYLFNLRFTPGELIRIGATTYLIHSYSRAGWLILADKTTGAPIDRATFNALPSVPFTAYTPASKDFRLFSFNYSTTTRFIIGIGNHILRVWSGGLNPTECFALNGVAYSKNVPYNDDQLDDLNMVQINDVIYLAHPLHPLYKLTRNSDTDWDLYPVCYSFPPLMEEYVEGSLGPTTLAASATTGAVTITAAGYRGQVVDDGFFSEKDVGSYFAISHNREIANAGVYLTANATSSALQAVGDWELSTNGTWYGNLFLERSTDGGATWDVIRAWKSENDRNFTSAGNQPFQAELRLRFVKGTGAPANSPRANLQLTDSTHTGLVKILSVTDGQNAAADVIISLYATTASKRWAESAFSDYRGHASALAMHEQRIFLAGSNSRTMSVWGSQIDDFENFRVGTNDADGIFLTLASGEQNKIEWMLSQKGLMIGTTGDEWSLTASDGAKALSATNLKAMNQSRYGSSNVQAIMLADVILFVQRNSRKVRELTYSFQKDGWVAVDLTLLAEHVTRGGINQVSYQQQPDSIFWALRGDGILVGMTYERDQSVVGWHRHVTDGTFESVAVIHGNGTEDEVWLVVARTIGGVKKLYVERFALNWRDYLDAGTSANWWYLDSGKRFANSPASANVSGLGHLEGKTVTVFTDAGAVETHAVAGGAITLAAAATGGIVGLPFTSTLQPMKLNIDLQDGTSQGRKARIHSMIARLYKSRGGEAMTNGGSWYSLGEASGVFTGDRKIALAGNFGDSADVTLRQTQPFPLTVLAIIPKWDSYGSE